MTNPYRIKRRAAGGASGPPSSLLNGELAFNEQNNVLYYGKGDAGSGVAASVIPIAGTLKTINGSSLLGSGDLVIGGSGLLWVRKDTDYLAVAGDAILADTRTGIVRVTLPASPAANATVDFGDYACTFSLFKLQVLRNGKLIRGLAEDMDVSEYGRRFTMTFIDNTVGWLPL